MADLVEDIAQLASGIAEQPLDGAELDLVAHGRRGAVRVDVVDLAGVDAGALQGGPHAPERAVAILGRGSDVIGVAGEAVADDLTVDACAACLGVLERLEHDDAGAFTHDEAIAVLVVGTRGLGGLVVEMGCERAAGREAGHGDTADRALGAASDHDIGIIKRNQARCIADSMRAGRTRRDNGVIGSLELMAN